MSSGMVVTARAVRTPQDLKKVTFNDETIPTATSVEQRGVEANCERLFELYQKRLTLERANSEVAATDGSAGEDVVMAAVASTLPTLHLRKDKHVQFLLHGLSHMAEGYSSLDASRPWLLYWILHPLDLMGERIDDDLKDCVVDFLLKCQNASGGFGGGPGQLSHLAPTYAAVNALVILGTEKALAAVDRPALTRWLNSLRQPDGSFLMHADGEVDIRGAYCALSIACLTNIYSDELFKNTDQWIVSCQTYEGGFGGVPGMEAHGGYSFLGIAGLMLMGKERLCNTDRLLRWAACKQMKLEGGFQGRTNKLVDGCYSFWQGGIFPVLHRALAEDGHVPSLSTDRWMFDQEALQEYVLLCCQEPKGGLVDKPGKARDFYHTCYTLSGLSVAQHFGGQSTTSVKKILIARDFDELAETHPLYNIGVEAVFRASKYYSNLPVPNI